MTRWAFVLGLAVAACGGGLAGQRSNNPLDASWLEGSKTITAKDLERVMDLGRNDPEASAIFREAIARIGGGRLEGLVPRFSVCGSDVTMEGGLTLVPGQEVWVARPLENLVAGTPPPYVKKLVDSPDLRETRVIDSPDVILVQQTMMPHVCIVGTLTLGEAYEAVVHELVHAVRLDPTRMTKLAAASADEHEFLMALVLLPGGEAEAYAAGTGARIRLGAMDRRAPAAIAWFDPGTGKLRTTPQALAEYVLASKPNGLGYTDGLLAGTFTKTRQTAIEYLVSKQHVEEQILNERRQNMEIADKNLQIHTQNIGVHKHNIEVGQARHDQGIIDRSRAGLVQVEREIATTRAMGDAARTSEARLVDELAVTGRQIDALRAGAPLP